MSDFSDEGQIAVLETVLGWLDRGQLGSPNQRVYAGAGMRKVIDRHRAYARRKREGKRGDLEEAIGHIERLAAMCPEGLAKDAAVGWVAERKRGGVA